MESRADLQHRPAHCCDSGSCPDRAFGAALPPAGTFTSYLPVVEAGTFVSTDLRVRVTVLAFGSVAAGGGWAWNHQLPFWSTGVTLNLPRGPWRAELEYGGFRVPVDAYTSVWTEDTHVSSVHTQHDWRGYWTVRVGAEWRLR